MRLSEDGTVLLRVEPSDLDSAGKLRRFPAGVTEIGRHAFYSCTGLTQVVIPAGVTKIGKSAFARCTGLTQVVIPAGVTEIGADAFYHCTGLTQVLILASVTTIGSRAFYRCTGLTQVVIPASVTEIGTHAFYDCTGLTQVVIPASVTEIGDAAFYYCTALTQVAIPASVTKIRQRAFADCTGLTQVLIPASVTEIGMDAFSNCRRLESIVIGTTDERECRRILDLLPEALRALLLPMDVYQAAEEIKDSLAGKEFFDACPSMNPIFKGKDRMGLAHDTVYEISAYVGFQAALDVKAALDAVVIPTSKEGLPAYKSQLEEIFHRHVEVFRRHVMVSHLREYQSLIEEEVPPAAKPGFFNTAPHNPRNRAIWLRYHAIEKICLACLSGRELVLSAAEKAAIGEAGELMRHIPDDMKAQLQLEAPAGARPSE